MMDNATAMVNAAMARVDNATAMAVAVRALAFAPDVVEATS
jgi:hypothetical protein